MRLEEGSADVGPPLKLGVGADLQQDVGVPDGVEAASERFLQGLGSPGLVALEHACAQIRVIGMRVRDEQQEGEHEERHSRGLLPAVHHAVLKESRGTIRRWSRS